jgi:putative endonuclease
VTNNIQRRLYEHKNKLISGFTAKYNVDKVVYLEEFDTSIEAITAEKIIKGWIRKKKIELITTTNPDWKDLSD